MKKLLKFRSNINSVSDIYILWFFLHLFFNMFSYAYPVYRPSCPLLTQLLTVTITTASNPSPMDLTSISPLVQPSPYSSTCSAIPTTPASSFSQEIRLRPHIPQKEAVASNACRQQLSSSVIRNDIIFFTCEAGSHHKNSPHCRLSYQYIPNSMPIYLNCTIVTARSRFGLWLQACGNWKRARMQRKIPQMVLQLLT